MEENNRSLDQTLQPNTVEAHPALTTAQIDVSDCFARGYLPSNYSLVLEIQELISRTTLNTNVSEFVPRHLQSSPSRTTLNVEVEEFHPRSYIQPAVQTKTTNDKFGTKQTSPEAQKVTILHRNATDTYNTQPTPSDEASYKNKLEPVPLPVPSAIIDDTSSTLISSISSRDKYDDNVNGVDNSKTIEKRVDPVNVKADLDDKAVIMHTKQHENILENVKKTKLNNIQKTSKSSPRKTNNGHKKDVRNGKGGRGITIIEKRENGSTASTKEALQPTESKQKDGAIPVEVNNKAEVDKPNQPTYAQMLGPVAKPKVNKTKLEQPLIPLQESAVPPTAIESKTSQIVEEVKPAVKVEATQWLTVRPKGKKKIVSVTYDEPEMQWDDCDEQKSVEVNEKITKVVEPAADQFQKEEQNAVAAAASDDKTAQPTEVKPPKNDKAKAKKMQKKIKAKNAKSNGIAVIETAEPKPNSTSTPKSNKLKPKPEVPIIDDLFGTDSNEILSDVDISNFSFETNPSMFVNAITNTSSDIFTNNSLSGKPNDVFTLSKSLKLLNTFDFCKTKGNVLLKEEEEMVIRVLKSFSQTDNQIVKEDIVVVVNDERNVKENGIATVSCDDAINGHSDSHDNDADDDVNDRLIKEKETNGAEILDDNHEVYANGDTMNTTELIQTNGHKTEEDTNLAVDYVDHNGTTNGHHLITELNVNTEEKDADETVASAQSVKLDGINVFDDEKIDLDVTTVVVTDKIETENVDEIINQVLVADNEGDDENDEENEVEIHKDCSANIKNDDETHSDLSELSDENDETIVSQSNDYFEYDEIETIKEMDLAELIDDHQLDDDFIFSNDEVITNDENELEPHEEDALSESDAHLLRPSSQNIFIENETEVTKTEFTLNDIEGTKNQDRIQSPRNSEDSGILESQDDGRYFSESDTDKTDQISIQNFPLTDAVSRWLEEKQKEKSPEPIFRLPDDPLLSQRIEKSLMSRMHVSQLFDHYDDDDDDTTSDESEAEFELKQTSKNLISNPLRVLFRKNETKAASNHSSNGIRKRVANRTESVTTVDEPDILDYWENDPMLQQSTQKSHVLNGEQNENCARIDTDTELEAYESVYGKTIDYANLSANIHNDHDDVFLSNNILNNGNKLSNLPINPIKNNNNNNNNIATDSSLPHASSSINGKNDKNLNCFKPPEICCMLM